MTERPPAGKRDERLPPWLARAGGGPGRGRGFGALARRLRGPALLLVGAAIGWTLHVLRAAPAPAVAAPPAVSAAPPSCPPSPCRDEPAPARPARHAEAHKRTVATPLALVPLPAEGPTPEEKRREALRAYAEKKAGELRSCLSQPGTGPVRRVGVALEIDGRGSVAAVQILGGDETHPNLAACYAARLRSWQFPRSLLDGPERLLVNFVL